MLCCVRQQQPSTPPPPPLDIGAIIAPEWMRVGAIIAGFTYTGEVGAKNENSALKKFAFQFAILFLQLCCKKRLKLVLPPFNNIF